MMKLLKSNFSRLRRNGIFKIAVVAAVCIGVLGPFGWYRKLLSINAPDSSYYMDNYLFGFMHILSFVVALFCSFFVAIDYSDGTLRNKLAVGHTRTEVYLTNLVTNAAAACIFFTIYLILVLCIGIPRIGAFRYFTRMEIVSYICSGYVLMISLAAIFTLIAMLSSRMVVSLGISFCALLAILCFGIHQLNMQTDVIFWLGESRRGLGLFFADFTPGGQMMQFYYRSYYGDLVDVNSSYFSQYMVGNLNPRVMIGGSAFFAAVSTGLGLLLFRKKELK